MSTAEPVPSEPAPVPTAWARAWALSLAWGWLVLLVAGALAVALDRQGFREALDLPGQVAVPLSASPVRDSVGR